MEVTVEKQGGVAIVRLPLEKLDLGSVAEFRAGMAPVVAAERLVALDLSNVHFVDSSGLGGLLSLLRELSGKGGDLKLFGIQRRVRAMFELVRMERVLSLCESQDEALSAFETQGVEG